MTTWWPILQYGSLRECGSETWEPEYDISAILCRYVLPLNAAMRIGFEQRNQPDTYYNIIDIINSTEPPKLISPRDDYRGNEGNSLTHDEVLLVKGVHVSRVRRLKSLNVVNMKTGEEKRIPSDCQVHFSTEPIYTQVHVKHPHSRSPQRS